jgi:alpha-L-rhamnosidase
MARPAPFIWTANQPIDTMGSFTYFLGAPRRSDGTNRWFLFRCSVDLDALPTTVPTKVTADGRYQLFVNDGRVARGPVRCSPATQKYDQVDIAPHLRLGRNVIGAIVNCFGQDKSWYESVKGQWQTTFGDGAFWLDGPIAASGVNWRCIQCLAWDGTTPEASHGLPNIESFDAGLFPTGWLDANFDDSGWDATQILESGGGGPEGMFGGMVVRPFPHLSPSGIPKLSEEFVAVGAPFSVHAVTPNPSLPIERRAYEEKIAPAEEGMVEAVDGALRIVTGENGAMLLFDFGRVRTGTVSFDLEAEAGVEIEIAVSERLPGEWEDGIAAGARIQPRPVFGHDAQVTRYVARAGKQHFESFFWQAIKWMQVTVRHAPNAAVLTKLGIVQTNYPVTAVGAFSSSDAMLDQLWLTGAETLKMCMHDGWEDCPSREQRQWLGDATVEQLVGQAAFGPSINPLNAKYLRDVAASQRPDGLVQMFAPGNHTTDGLTIPDWTLQWILNARNHLLWSGDVETIEAVFPAIERALMWFDRCRGASGLVADMPNWHFMDWAGLGREGEACALNAQLAGCFTAAAEMADVIERPKVALRFRHDASTIGDALNQRHWDEARGVYIDCVDPETGAQSPRVSQHANAAMILWGAAPVERWSRIIQRITDPDRMTFTAAPPVAPVGATLDEQEGVVLANTFYSHFVYTALIKAGRADIALALMRRFYGPMLEKGATTLWESFDPIGSLCHGFSASPTYHLLTGVLGLQPLADGFAGLRIAPQTAGLERVEGKIETMAGSVGATLEVAVDELLMTINLPDAMPHEIVPPRGYRLAEEQRDGGRISICFRLSDR